MTLLNKRRIITVIQWSLTVAAFWYVARDISWREATGLFATIDAWVLLAVCSITVLEFGARFSQWYVLLNALDRTPVSTVARIDLVIKFINHVIPSKISGHAVAPLVVRHYTGTDWPDATTIAVLNTGLYAALYGFVTLFGLSILFGRLPDGLNIVILLSTAVYVFVGVLILFTGRQLELADILFSWTETILVHTPYIGERLVEQTGKIPSFTADTAATFRSLSSRPSVLIPYTLGWVGTLMIFPGIRFSLLLTEFGGSFEQLWLIPIVLVVAYSVTILPLTPGGVGIAEASATLVFIGLGVSGEIAVAVVFIDRIFGVYLPALLGAIPMANLDISTLVTNGE